MRFDRSRLCAHSGPALANSFWALWGLEMNNLAQTHYANKAILALAPGIQTGFAFCPMPRVIISGSWNISPARGDSGLRDPRLKANLDRFDIDYSVEVLYAQGRHLTAWSPERGIVPQPVGLGQIKKFWTGRGNVTKEDMAAEARARGFDPVDGNEATALALLHWRVILGPSADVALAA
jgi:hypothetical protein